MQKFLYSLLAFAAVFAFICGVYGKYKLFPETDKSKILVSSAMPRAIPYVFQKDLLLGSFSTDVLILQQCLNSDPATVVTVSGPGSKGKETSYFGPATKAAVMNFQMKYADEALFPYGLQSPTGYVGKYTRAVLNQYCP